jgi:hypothetical protein
MGEFPGGKRRSTTHPSCMFLIYVRVIILFCTKSLKYSTVVPWLPMTGLDPAISVPPVLIAPGGVCISQSLPAPPIIMVPTKPSKGELTGGVGVDGYEDGPEIGDGLKDERRFCADDFRRIPGRDGSVAGDIWFFCFKQWPIGTQKYPFGARRYRSATERKKSNKGRCTMMACCVSQIKSTAATLGLLHPLSHDRHQLRRKAVH